MFPFVLYPSLSSKVKATILHFDRNTTSFPSPAFVLICLYFPHAKWLPFQLSALKQTNLLWLSLRQTEKTQPQTHSKLRACLCVLAEIFGLRYRGFCHPSSLHTVHLFAIEENVYNFCFFLFSIAKRESDKSTKLSLSIQGWEGPVFITLNSSYCLSPVLITASVRNREDKNGKKTIYSDVDLFYC